MIKSLSAMGTLMVVLVAAPLALAQDPVSVEVQTLMLEGHDRLLAATKLTRAAKALGGAAAKAKVEEAHALYDRACGAYAEALVLLPRTQGAAKDALLEVRRIIHYNTACARAGQGDNAKALDAFARALEAGYDDFVRIEADPDLDPLRREPRFVQLLERIQAKMVAEAREAGTKNLSKDALFVYDFKVTTIDGEVIRLSQLRGKIVIVDFWGTWCAPCLKEIPHFVKLKEEFEERLEIVGMTWEQGQSGAKVIKKIRRAAKKLKINYPLTLVTRQADLDKVPDWKGFPTTLFIDKKGRVRAKEVGYRDYETIHEMLHALDDEEYADPEPEQKKPERARPF